MFSALCSVGSAQAVVPYAAPPDLTVRTFLWLDAKESSTVIIGNGTTIGTAIDNGLVTEWRDRSGNANHHAAGYTSTPERSDIKYVTNNGLPSVEQTNSMKPGIGLRKFGLSKFPNENHQSVLLVVYTPTAVNPGFVSGGLSDGIAELIDYGLGSVRRFGTENSSTSMRPFFAINNPFQANSKSSASSAVSMNQPALVSYSVPASTGNPLSWNSGSNFLKGFSNGAVFSSFSPSKDTSTPPKDTSITVSNTSATMAQPTTRSNLFGSSIFAAGVWPFIGRLHEVIIADTTGKNSTEADAIRVTLEGYLAWKWGTFTSLPTEHKWKNSAPNVVFQSAP